MRQKSWKITDEFWSKVEPLIPKPKRDPNKSYQRKRGAGRKPMEMRKVFEAIMFVLRTGIQWKALPKEYGSSSSVHRYFQKWSAEGLFLKLWKKGLAEYDEMEGIAWKWQNIDGCMTKAPMAQESVEPSHRGRGKKMKQVLHSGRRAWGPVVNRRNRSKQT